MFIEPCLTFGFIYSVDSGEILSFVNHRVLEEFFDSCKLTLAVDMPVSWLSLQGVSKFAVLYALAKQARNLGAYKLARHVLDRINNLKVRQYIGST